MLSQHVEVASGRPHRRCNGALDQLQRSCPDTGIRLLLFLQMSRLYNAVVSALTYTGPNAADKTRNSSHISLLSALGLLFQVRSYIRQILGSTLVPISATIEIWTVKSTDNEDSPCDVGCSTCCS